MPIPIIDKDKLVEVLSAKPGDFGMSMDDLSKRLDETIVRLAGTLEAGAMEACILMGRMSAVYCFIDAFYRAGYKDGQKAAEMAVLENMIRTHGKEVN